MHVARLVIVLLIILAVVLVYNPQAREQAVKTWEQIKPTVVNITNSLYVTIRDLVNGSPSRSGPEQRPVPGPGLDFQRIVTMSSSSVL